jgi:hypothetical protein
MLKRFFGCKKGEIKEAGEYRMNNFVTFTLR